MDLNSIFRVGPLLGQGLSIEEVSGLEVAMLQRKLQENLSCKMYFWGKIFGSTQDYLVVFHLSTLEEFPEKKFYYCTTSDYTLRALPELSEAFSKQAENISKPFLGDPAFFAYNGEEPEAEEQDSPDISPVERFKELHRLAFVVNKIDNDCTIVPRGSYSVDAAKKVGLNPNFAGLSFDTSKEPRAFMHFRRPLNLQGIALMKRPGILKSDEFLDCIDKDLPRDVWTITHDSGGSTVFVRNHFWEGYGFFAILKSSDFGGAYFGTGVPNFDVAFGL